MLRMKHINNIIVFWLKQMNPVFMEMMCFSDTLCARKSLEPKVAVIAVFHLPSLLSKSGRKVNTCYQRSCEHYCKF